MPREATVSGKGAYTARHGGDKILRFCQLPKKKRPPMRVDAWIDSPTTSLRNGYANGQNVR